MSENASTSPRAETADPGRPEASRVVPPVFRRRDALGLGAFAVLALLAASTAGSGFSRGLVGQWAILAIAGLGFYLAFGIGGQFTFAQAAFVGVGAYTSAWLTEVHGFPYLLGLLGAIIAAAVVGALLFLLIVRCSAFYFAIATLAFAYLALVVFRQWTAFAGPGGERHNLTRIAIGGSPLTGRGLVLFLVIAVIALLGLALLIERSPLARAAAALRELPVAAPTFGVDVLRTRLTMFVAGCAYGGIAGSLMVHRMGVVSSENFDIPFAIDLFLVLFLGGLGSAWGPILGAAFVVWAPEQLRFIGRDKELIFGGLLIVIMIFVPDGLVGIAARLRSLVRRDGGEGSTLAVGGGGPGGPSTGEELPT